MEAKNQKKKKTTLNANNNRERLKSVPTILKNGYLKFK